MNSSAVTLMRGGSGAAGFFYEPTATGAQGSVAPQLAAWACAGLIALAATGQTTGGSRIAQSTLVSVTSDAPWIVSRGRDQSVASASETAAAAEESEQIRVVRRAFSMTMQHVADAVGVTRAVVYRWREGSAVPRMGHRSRLNALSRLAEYFVLRGGRSVGFALHRPVRGSETLFDLLKRDPIPETDIKVVLTAIATAEVRRESTVRIGDALQRRGVQPLASSASESDREDDRIARFKETSERE